MHDTDTQDGWTRVAFGDVVKLSGERSSNPEQDGFDRFVGLDHIDPGDLRIRRWGDLADGSSFTSVFRVGQVLFGKRRAYQRKVALADFSGVCSSDIYVLVSRSAKLIPEMLPFICQTEGFFQHALGTSAGSLSPRTNWESLAKYEFALPPLVEQRRMVRVLHAATAAAEALEAAAQAALRVQQALMVSHFAADASPYDVRTLEDLAIRVNDGTHQPPMFASSGVPFLLVSNISGGRIDWVASKYVSREVFEELSRTWRPQIDDVLYSLVGTYGVPALVDRETEFTFQRHIGLIRPDASKLSPRFLYWYLKSPAGRQQAHLRAEGLAQKTITLGALRSFLIPTPSLERQLAIVSEIDASDVAMRNLQGRARSIRRVAIDLMTTGFAGDSDGVQ